MLIEDTTMKLTKHLLLIFIVTAMYCWVNTAHAATMTVTPITVEVGNKVTVTITGHVNQYESGSFTVDFGDNSPINKSQVFSNMMFGGAVETYTTTHTYFSLGNFVITGKSVGFFIDPPLIVTANISVNGINPDLPRGTVGDEYKHTLKPLTGVKTYSYKRAKGKLPPGLKLDIHGRITGIPTQKGQFPFTVRVSTPRDVSFLQDLVISIDAGELIVQVTPETLNVTSGGPSNQKVTFTVIKPLVPINETIRSNRGEFYLGGRMVGSINRPLNINLNQASPSATETFSIPQSVLQAVQSSGTGKVRYRRSFRPNNLRSGYAEAKVHIRSPASGELRITKLRIYFEQNNRPTILVERNTRDLTGAIKIHYNGSGIFKGYWQVGSRIIERVQKNVFYGKVMTLKTPKTPPLPTYSEGAHRLQFIITEPETAGQKIDFPEAFYHVEATRATIVENITLKNPAQNAEFSTVEESFTWSEVRGAQTYKIAFYKNDGDDSFFSAYTKMGSYTIHPRLLKLHFEEGEMYQWQVRSFNSAGEMNGESPKQKFSLVTPIAFAQGQVIFLVNNDDNGKALIEKMTTKYNLQIKEQVALSALNQIMIICYTETDIDALLKELHKETGVFNVQPNYIFSTLQTQDPLRAMQTIDKILDLDTIHTKLTGKNVLVAIVDTGVDIRHKDLQQSIKEYRNYISGSDYIGEIHGTAVAGIIAGAQNDFGILGIAPDAKLLALRACSQKRKLEPAGECLSASIAKAIDAAIMLNADIANLSVGSLMQDPLVGRLIHAGAKAGMLFTAPVGNNPQAKNLAFPASHPNVTAVAGFDKAGNPLPNKDLAIAADAVAPAEDIFSATPEDHHNFMDGTSFSTATISGILALSIEAGKKNYLINLPKFDSINNWRETISLLIGVE